MGTWGAGSPCGWHALMPALVNEGKVGFVQYLPRAACSLQPGGPELGHRLSLLPSGWPGLQKQLSQKAGQTLPVPTPLAPWGSPASTVKARLPHHSGHQPGPGGGARPPPHPHGGPVLPGGADVLHGGGGGLGEGPPVAAGPVPRAHSPPEKLLSVSGEVRHPYLPSGTQLQRAGSAVCVCGGPLQASLGCDSGWDRQPPRRQERGSAWRCGRSGGQLCRRPAGGAAGVRLRAQGRREPQPRGGWSGPCLSALGSPQQSPLAG